MSFSTYSEKNSRARQVPTGEPIKSANFSCHRIKAAADFFQANPNYRENRFFAENWPLVPSLEQRDIEAAEGAIHAKFFSKEGTRSAKNDLTKAKQFLVVNTEVAASFWTQTAKSDVEFWVSQNWSAIFKHLLKKHDGDIEIAKKEYAKSFSPLVNRDAKNRFGENVSACSIYSESDISKIKKAMNEGYLLAVNPA